MLAQISSEAVIARLGQFGYAVGDDATADKAMINFCIDKVQNTIKNYINWPGVPDSLYEAAVDMVVGEFLMAKKTWDPESLENSGLDLGVGIKELREGDKTTTFATGESGSQTDEQRLDDFIDHLRNDGMNQLACFRRIRW